MPDLAWTPCTVTADGADANGNATPANAAGLSSAPDGSELLDPANEVQLTRRNSFEVGLPLLSVVMCGLTVSGVSRCGRGGGMPGLQVSP